MPLDPREAVDGAAQPARGGGVQDGRALRASEVGVVLGRRWEPAGVQTLRRIVVLQAFDTGNWKITTACRVPGTETERWSGRELGSGLRSTHRACASRSLTAPSNISLSSYLLRSSCTTGRSLRWGDSPHLSARDRHVSLVSVPHHISPASVCINERHVSCSASPPAGVSQSSAQVHSRT